MKRILQGAKGLTPIPREACDAYTDACPTLVEAVNATLAKRPGIEALIGGNPLSVMFDNHRHHAQLMANVFRFNQIAILTRIVPWVYRSYRARQFRPDYFPVALEAWMAAIAARLDPGLAEPILAVYRWLRENHEAWIELSRREAALETPYEARPLPEREAFLAALLEGDHKACLNIARGILRGSGDLQGLYLGIMQPCLYEIGALWERGVISVAQEHLATAVVSRVMASLYGNFDAWSPHRGCAVVTCAANEYHEIGGRMVADLLEIDGWDVLFLGANTPVREVIPLLKGHDPTFMALSLAMPFNVDAARELIAAVRKEPGFKGLRVMVGGLAFHGLPGLWEQTGADGWAPDGRAAVELARRWQEEEGKG